MALFGFSGLACDNTAAAKDLPQPADDAQLATETGEQKVVFAAGCFWCVEAVFDQLEGVSDVVSGYAGGTAETANYEAVSTGQTNHAEVIQITYDPSKITYGQLVRIFFATHNPTTLNQQGPDHGSQYRSAIFYETDEQKRIAESYVKQMVDAGIYKPGQIVTTLEKLEKFYPAEAYHQDYAAFNPGNPYIRAYVPSKIEKLKKVAGEKVKAGR